jgi:hypothetical protein
VLVEPSIPAYPCSRWVNGGSSSSFYPMSSSGTRHVRLSHLFPEQRAHDANQRYEPPSQPLQVSRRDPIHPSAAQVQVREGYLLCPPEPGWSFARHSHPGWLNFVLMRFLLCFFVPFVQIVPLHIFTRAYGRTRYGAGSGIKSWLKNRRIKGRNPKDWSFATQGHPFKCVKANLILGNR